MVQEANRIEPHLRAIGRDLVRLAALRVAAGIERNHPVVALETGDDSRVDPALERSAVAVQEHDRLALATVDVTDAHAVRVEVLILSEGRARAEHEDGCHEDGTRHDLTSRVGRPSLHRTRITSRCRSVFTSTPPRSCPGDR
jgi:hypothetical protein